MKNYVVGLAFSKDASQILFIRKNRPAWQQGKLNGTGGAVEAGESAAEAMSRECSEECLIRIPPANWQPIAVMQDDEIRVDAFCCFDDAIFSAAQGTDEAVEILAVDDPRIEAQGIGSLRPLIVRALQRDAKHILQLPTNRPKPAAAAGPVCR